VTNLRQGQDWDWIAGLSASILSAMSWIHDHTDADFILRIDADALVIGSFAASIRQLMHARADAGVIGTLGLSCNPHIRAYQDLRKEAKLLTAYKLWPRASHCADDEADLEIPGFLTPVTKQAREAFDSLRPHIEEAILHGYSAMEYCQGGACAVTRLMLDRMAGAGYLDHPETWLPLRVTDDLILAMYARAVGLSLCEFSNPGEPFGVQHRGLPYPPEELLARRHTIIHSVKNDPRHSEIAIRQFFADLPRHAECPPAMAKHRTCLEGSHQSISGA
jgi:hypothetical protein